MRLTLTLVLLPFIAWKVCESLAVSAGSQEKGAIGAMFEREMKQEKNLEVRLQCIKVHRSGNTFVLLLERRLMPTRFTLVTSLGSGGKHNL